MKLHLRKAGATAATVLLATLSLAGAAAQAADAKKPFVLTAFVNGAGGKSVIAGRYELALKQIHGARHNTILASTIPTNMCVAHTMLRHWNDAKAACDKAITTALQSRPRTSYGAALSEIREHETTVAIAYSNRAVVNWLSKEAVAAAEDLAKAHKFAPEAPFVASNMEAFKAPREVAQVAVAK
jgi:hypothetical protein